ncbi:hypothetical protein [Inquilinus sp. Marseille-Q2685]|uniref:hypothetical protein n=1 Tax=Inquilinus sp. Marseille-Q2685 TaxID=2866581 RepID=UPI001CE4A1DC|nr:hypothetical protein [Inquilinus sp. Marseille-Q2685]
MDGMRPDCEMEDRPVDRDLAWTQWALGSLAELVDIHLRTARMMATEQLATPILQARPDFALAQVRLARSVRLSIAMSQRIREGYQERRAGTAERTPAEEAAAEAAPAEAVPAAGPKDGEPRAEPRESLVESECLEDELEPDEAAEERRDLDPALLPRAGTAPPRSRSPIACPTALPTPFPWPLGRLRNGILHPTNPTPAGPCRLSRSRTAAEPVGGATAWVGFAMRTQHLATAPLLGSRAVNPTCDTAPPSILPLPCGRGRGRGLRASARERPGYITRGCRRSWPRLPMPWSLARLAWARERAAFELALTPSCGTSNA